jgi:shikimate dehydrogenase
MRINADTQYLGLFGDPVAHSLSPLLHNYILQEMGYNYIYLPFAIPGERLEDAVNAIRSLNFRGVNVTIPHKEAVIPYLDEISPAAAACGAVNVISNENGRLRGYNTDGAGFIASLQEAEVPLQGRALFIGAGGAARSLAVSLAAEGISQLDFIDINLPRAEALADSLALSHISAAAYLMSTEKFTELASLCNIIINCTPVGMYPAIDESPVAALDMLQPGAVVCDIIYNPLHTRFLAMGQARGLKTINGLSMFVHQAALSLEIWLGIKPLLQPMKEVLRRELA